MVVLSELSPISGSTNVNPSLTTTPPFTPSTADSFTAAKTSCSDIVSQAKSEDINTFLENYALKDGTSIKGRLTSFKTELSLAATTQDIRSKLGYSTSGINVGVDEFMNSLETTHMPVIRLVDNCLRENLEADMTDYNTAKATADESKTRLESILTPEQHTSYYDGWFPIIRPMTEISLFFVFGVALFMFIVSIMIFLSMTGVSLQIHIPEGDFVYRVFGYSLPPGITYYLYGGLFTGLVGTYIAFRFKYI
jgi:hypothetical protein